MADFLDNIDYRILFRECNDAVFIEDMAGNILSVNKRAEELYGYTGREFTELKVTDLIPPNVADQLGEIVKTLKADKQLKLRTKNVKKNGEIFDVDVSLQVVEFSGKEIVFAIIRDISQLMELQRRHKEQWENYKTLAELSQNVIMVHNDKDVLFANNKLYELFRIPYDKKLSVPFLLSLADPECRKKMAEYSQKRLAGEYVPESYEISGYTIDGKTLNMILSARKITFDGKPAILVNFVDITEFRKMETKLKFLNKLLKAISMVNQLIVREKNIYPLLAGISNILENIGIYTNVLPFLYEDGELKCPDELSVDEKLKK